MNDDSPVSVDVSVAFFASVLVLFVFVSFSLNRDTPRMERASTGQVNDTATAIPPTWSPIPERTSYAFLDGRQLQVLDLGHFSEVMYTPQKIVSSDAHYENVTILKDRNAPEAFNLTLGTVGGSLPAEWVRVTVPVVNTNDGSCPIDDQIWAAFKRRLLSVLVMRSESVNLPQFVSFAEACDLRYRLIPLPAVNANGRVNIPISLQPASFRFEVIFR